jgi:hypothetical protein
MRCDVTTAIVCRPSAVASFFLFFFTRPSRMPRGLAPRVNGQTYSSAEPNLLRAKTPRFRPRNARQLAAGIARRMFLLRMAAYAD